MIHQSQLIKGKKYLIKVTGGETTSVYYNRQVKVEYNGYSLHILYTNESLQVTDCEIISEIKTTKKPRKIRF